MRLDRADRCAERLLAWLTPHAVRIAVAGSVRRRRPEVSDIDLVVVPSRLEERDMFGTVERVVNSTWKEISARCEREGWRVERAGADIVTFHAGDVQVDVFWATEETWGTHLLTRTGSKEHNIWLAKYAGGRGGKWFTSVGLYLNNRKFSSTEEEIYEALGLPPIPPQNREADRLPFASIIRMPDAAMTR